MAHGLLWPILASATDPGRTPASLDLTRLDFVDTTGLGCLLELRSTLHGRGVLFEIAADEGPVRQAVDVTGLGHLLTVNAE